MKIKTIFSFLVPLGFSLALLPSAHTEPSHLAPLSSQAKEKKSKRVVEEVFPAVLKATPWGKLRIQSALYSHMKDKGDENDDKTCSQGSMVTLSDGMGGVLCGKRSSEIATRVLKHYFETHSLEKPSEESVKARLKAGLNIARAVGKIWNQIQLKILSELQLGRPPKDIPDILINQYGMNPYFDQILDRANPKDTWAQAVRDVQKGLKKLLISNLKWEIRKTLSAYQYKNKKAFQAWASAYLKHSSFLGIPKTLPLQEILRPQAKTDLGALKLDFEKQLEDVRRCLEGMEQAGLSASTETDLQIVNKHAMEMYRTLQALPKIFENYRFPYPLFSDAPWMEKAFQKMDRLFQDIMTLDNKLPNFFPTHRGAHEFISDTLNALPDAAEFHSLFQFLGGWPHLQRTLSEKIISDAQQHLDSGSTLVASDVLQTGHGKFLVVTESVGDSRIYALARYPGGKVEVKRLTLDRPPPGMKEFDIADYDTVYQEAYQHWPQVLNAKLAKGAGYHEKIEGVSTIIGAFPKAETVTSVARFENVEFLALVAFSDFVMANQDRNVSTETTIETTFERLSKSGLEATDLAKTIVQNLRNKKETSPASYRDDDGTAHVLTFHNVDVSLHPSGTQASA